MNKVKIFYVFLLAASVIFLASCSSELSIHGLWQDTNAAGTIEFKTNGEVIIIDNMSATVTGTFEINKNDSITFELTATDIMSDSIQPTEKRTVTAKIVEFNDNKLQLNFNGEKIEHYKRLR
ncbi:MAG: hypothetical protein HND53_08865 [Proteobacteria bacterium]|nr:hypothetical protein [Pseudomonadota bacterium]NOG60595.1 hypothetical protein [Pseudomonadota bacterium]